LKWFKKVFLTQNVSTKLSETGVWYLRSGKISSLIPAASRICNTDYQYRYILSYTSLIDIVFAVKTK